MLSRPKKLALGLVPVVLLLLLAEPVARGLELLLWGAPYPEGQPQGLYERRDGRSHLVPGVELDGLLVKVAVNSWGFRDDEVVEPRPPDALRVWVVGGSTTFDIYARDNDAAWPNLLERRLQEALPERSVEVLNAGIPGEVLMGSVEDLQTWGERFQPEVVVLYHGPNDLRSQMSMPSGAAPPPPMEPPGALAHFSRELALGRLLARASSPAPWVDGGAFQPREHLRMARRGLEEAVQASRRLGARPLLATHPFRVVLDEQGGMAPEMNELALLLTVPPEQAVLALESYNDMVRQMASEQGIPLAEVAAAVDASPQNWGDLTHFRRPGAEACAEAVSQALLDSPELLQPR